MTSSAFSTEFQQLYRHITDFSYAKHRDHVLNNAIANEPYVKQSIKMLPALQKPGKLDSAIVISAGPSLRRQQSIQQIKASGYQGTVIAVDASYAACLREGLVPDFVVTLDPHPTRIIRWFGDNDLAKHLANDDYFQRQDLDVKFRSEPERVNAETIELINANSQHTRVLIATCSPPNVSERLYRAGYVLYWWNPLADNPDDLQGITRQLYDKYPIPCLNTGGNVGTASWVFAVSRLKIPRVGLVGMDLGYYRDTPYRETQTYDVLREHQGGDEGLEAYFTEFTFPLTQEIYYADVTYYWYRSNFLELLSRAPGKTYNCTEGGTLYADNLPCLRLNDFLTSR